MHPVRPQGQGRTAPEVYELPGGVRLRFVPGAHRRLGEGRPAGQVPVKHRLRLPALFVCLPAVTHPTLLCSNFGSTALSIFAMQHLLRRPAALSTSPTLPAVPLPTQHAFTAANQNCYATNNLLESSSCNVSLPSAQKSHPQNTHRRKEKSQGQATAGHP